MDVEEVLEEGQLKGECMLELESDLDPTLTIVVLNFIIDASIFRMMRMKTSILRTYFLS